MGVKLREKSLKKGAVSFYLDISHAGKRWYEFLDIKAEGSRKSATFIEKKKLADKARSTREYQITVEKIGMPDDTKKGHDFYAFVLERSASMKREIGYKYLNQLIFDYCQKEVLPMEEITKDFLLGFQEYLKTRGLGASTIYVNVHRFSTYIYKAVEAGFMADNPYQKIPRNLRVRMKRNTPDYLTMEQIDLLAKKGKGISEQLKLAFFFSCFAGLRWSDCSRLKWSQISKQKMESRAVTVLHLTQMKTQHSAHLPLSEQAVEVLDQRRKLAEKETLSPYVFPDLYEPDGSTKKQGMCQRHITKWGEQAGLERLYFHLARHTFATLTLSEGADLYTVSKLLGHTDIHNTMIYAHVVDRLKMDAVARLPKLTGNLSGGKRKMRKAG
ncbi:MAG: site-specific integrase [Bacteroidia bacterium]